MTKDRWPWWMRRLLFAWAFREWPWRIPDECRLIGLDRPPENVFRYFRQLHGIDEPGGEL